MHAAGPLCPHCLEVNHGISHFSSESQATANETVLCARAGQRIARGEYWGWACAPGHICHVTALPLVPPVEGGRGR